MKCLDQPIDTTTPVGKLLFTILAAVAEFEADLIRERTMDGLATARAKGNLGGRSKSYDGTTAAAVLLLRDMGEMSMNEIAAACKVSRRTAYRILADANAEAEAA